MRNAGPQAVQDDNRFYSHPHILTKALHSAAEDQSPLPAVSEKGRGLFNQASQSIAFLYSSFSFCSFEKPAMLSMSFPGWCSPKGKG